MAFIPPVSIRVRLVLLVAAVLLPIAVLAAVTTWLDERAMERQPLRIAQEIVEVAAARQETRLDDAGTALHGFGQSMAVGPAACSDLIAVAAAAMPSRVESLSLIDQAGRAVCEASVPGIAASDAEPTLSVRVAIPAGVLLARVRAEQPASAPSRRIWLVAAGRPPPGAGDALPEAPLLDALLAGPGGVRVAKTRAGEPAAFASRMIAPGVHLLASVSFSAAAVRPLLSTATILGMVGISLAILAIGVDRLVVRPMRQLQNNVRRWRSGTEADAGDISGLPRELRDLALSFGVATSALAERERDLRSALAQQDLLMHEIHHRVKNNLQIVASLLNLQASRIRQPEARAEFQSARDRVRALATLHRHLYGHGELHTINMRDFLNELCAQLFRGFQEEPGDRIALEIDATELKMTSDQAVPMALIVTETVSNSLKFAFPDRHIGRIHVALSEPAGSVRLVIEDDGVGFPTEGEGAAAEGIGRQLIRGFARQLDARLTVSADQGVRYELEIALPKHGPAEKPEAATPASGDREARALPGTRQDAAHPGSAFV